MRVGIVPGHAWELYRSDTYYNTIGIEKSTVHVTELEDIHSKEIYWFQVAILRCKQDSNEWDQNILFWYEIRERKLFYNPHNDQEYTDISELKQVKDESELSVELLNSRVVEAVDKFITDNSIQEATPNNTTIILKGKSEGIIELWKESLEQKGYTVYTNQDTDYIIINTIKALDTAVNNTTVGEVQDQVYWIAEVTQELKAKLISIEGKLRSAITRYQEQNPLSEILRITIPDAYISWGMNRYLQESTEFVL